MPTRLEEIAPRIGRAHAAERAHQWRRISRCWDGGYHFAMAGPCFDTPEQAMRYRDRQEAEERRREARRNR